MKNIVVKYWMINLLLAIFMYVAYRIAITGTTAMGKGFLATILYIMDILVNLAFSLLYLAAMVVCSFLVFLNLIKNIRGNYVLSWLTFSGAPILVLVFITITSLADGYHSGVMTKLLMVATLYPFITTFLFIRFRRSIFQIAENCETV